jgi:hypothetical protein
LRVRHISIARRYTYWHSPIPPEFIAISGVDIAEGINNQ